jgi:hypothetical protein
MHVRNERNGSSWLTSSACRSVAVSRSGVREQRPGASGRGDDTLGVPELHRNGAGNAGVLHPDGRDRWFIDRARSMNRSRSLVLPLMRSTEGARDTISIRIVLAAAFALSVVAVACSSNVGRRRW